MEIAIRPATLEDIDWLVDELRKFSSFYGTRLQLFGNEAYIRSFLSDTMDRNVMLIAVRKDVGPVGFIAGLIYNHSFNPEIRVLGEIAWWVSEEHRNTRAGLMLADAFIEYGKATVDWVTMALEEQSPVKDQFFLKRGFKSQERSFLMEVS